MEKSIFTSRNIQVSDDTLAFIRKLLRKERYHLPYETNPYHVLDRVNNRTTRREIMDKLIGMGYDFNTPFPYHALVSDFPFLSIVKENLLKEMNYYQFYISKGKKMTSCNGLNLLYVQSSRNITKNLFKFNFSIILYHDKKGNWVISLHPELKKRYSLENIHRKLIGQEKEKWTLQYGGTYLIGKDSLIYPKEMLQYFKDFDLKK